MHWVPMLLRDSGTLEGNSRDLFWMVTWKMICKEAQAMSLALCRPIRAKSDPALVTTGVDQPAEAAQEPRKECTPQGLQYQIACQESRCSFSQRPHCVSIQGSKEAKLSVRHAAHHTCICIMPAHGRLPVHISHSSTPKAYTSTLLLRRPVVSSSGGMCVTVPKVPVLMASCESTLLSPKSATCKHHQHVTAALHIFQGAQWSAAWMAWV